MPRKRPPTDRTPCCSPSAGGCACGSTPDRRTFLASVAAGGAALALDPLRAIAGPFGADDVADFPVPRDKRFAAEWLRSLRARGEPRWWTKSADELRFIGMPVGGLCAGQVYCGGDGRLWHWDVLNLPQDEAFRSTRGPHYAKPAEVRSPFAQGFVLAAQPVGAAGARFVGTLDADGFAEVRFRGEYPIARVEYRDPSSPVDVDLEAFSPFCPLDENRSSLPCTILRYTLRNRSSSAVDATIAGWLENPAHLRSGAGDATPRSGARRTRAIAEPAWRGIVCDALPPEPPARPDITVADFESGTYRGWTATGTAFGEAPRSRANIADYQGDVRMQGRYAVNTHETRSGEDVVRADTHIGTLTSEPFRIERDWLRFRIGGGRHPGQTGVHLLVDGAPVRTETGRDSNAMHVTHFDLREFAGSEARLQVVDGWTGGWGQVGADEFVLTDSPELEAFGDAPDHGTMALAAVREAATDSLADIGEGPPHERALDATSGPVARRPFPQPLVGAVRAKRRLGPGEEATVTFVLAWHFGRTSWEPLPLPNATALRREYSRRFADAREVVDLVANDIDSLVATTRLWRDTWHDSTLPQWLLDRTLANASTLATATCLRLVPADDAQAAERFYGWEGTYCCAGTCQHVWQYGQSVARLFPALERNVRETVDFGIAWHESGAVDYRAEAHRIVAHDGLAGTILRVWREHQMSADDSFLRRAWPRVKASVCYLMREDRDADGLLEGAQYNTLDTTWHGPMAWISSLYIAALRAGEAMATAVGDDAFAAECATRAAAGSQALVARLFNGEWFVHAVDESRPEANSTNDGCHIDQVFGQACAWQYGLPRVVPRDECRSALRSLYAYSFTPDIGPYRTALDATQPGGRWYAMPGEGGLLMCTWPPHRGRPDGAARARGKGRDAWAAGYFVECMSGFEHQVAAHMIHEGLVDEGLAIERMIHDRYDASRRNPYNEVECSDHYARAMASHGVFLAVCGFTCNGPRGEIGFAPRLTPERFRCAFVASTGWGSYEQAIADGAFTASLALRFGSLRLRELSVEVPLGCRPSRLALSVDGRGVPARASADEALSGLADLRRLRVACDVTLQSGSRLELGLPIGS